MMIGKQPFDSWIEGAYWSARATFEYPIIKLLKVVIRLTACSLCVNHDALRRRRQPARIALQ